MKNIAFITTDSKTIDWFLKPLIEKLSTNKKFQVFVFSSLYEENYYNKNNVKYFKIPIKRKVNIFFDLITLAILVFYFYKFKICFVHSIMPKSGLLSNLAAFFLGIPLRIHTFTGQVWVNQSFIKRYILKLIDKIISILCTNVLCDSLSQRRYLIDHGIVKKDKIDCISKGSIIGVNLHKFKFDKISKEKIRKENNIPIESFVYIFVGRINKDKGIYDLLKSFELLFKKNINPYLLIVGPTESFDNNFLNKLNYEVKKNIIFSNYTIHISDYLSAADVLCLPSYREGFSNVIIEAAAIGIPSIVSEIYGLKESVINNVTGLKHKPGNIIEISDHMYQIFKNDNLRKKLASNSKERVNKYFDQKYIIDCILNYYSSKGLNLLDKYILKKDNIIKKNKNILVIGGNGYIGSSICKYLLSLKNNNVFCVTKKRNYNFDEKIYQIVINKEQTINYYQDILPIIDTIIFLPKNNIKFAQSIMKEAIKYQVKKFIYFSSVSVYSNTYELENKIDISTQENPENNYAKMKLKIESKLKEINHDSKTNLIILRLPAVYGNGCRGDMKLLITFLKNNFPLICPRSKNRRSLLNILDLCELISILCNNKNLKQNSTYLVSENTDISSKELIFSLKNNLSSKSIILYLPSIVENFFYKHKFFPFFVKSLFLSKSINNKQAVKDFDWEPSKNIINNFKDLNLYV